MKKLTLKQLQAKVEAAQVASAKKVAESAAYAGLEAMLALESSDSLFEAKVKLAATGNNTAKLQKLVDDCSGIIDNVPVTNSKTRSQRVWAGSRRFAFGNQVNLAYQLATGILYSCAEHKTLLLEHTKLNSELLEQLTEAFGTPAYYSRNYNALVEAKMYDVEAVKASLNVMQSQLGVIIDTSQLTAEEFSLEFGKAEKVAYDNMLKAEEAIAEVDLEL